jgi:hypothetical protein
MSRRGRNPTSEAKGDGGFARVRARAGKLAMSVALLPLQDFKPRPSQPDERAAGANLALLGWREAPEGANDERKAMPKRDMAVGFEVHDPLKNAPTLWMTRFTTRRGRHGGGWGECGEMVAAYSG